ncbi:MAG: acyl--CoA ligase [Sphingomonadales bacterium]|nr:acyl--CoA ligase [Sphingomonadales bacterium]
MNEGAGGLSLLRGIPLDEEQGIGALTLAGWLREIRDRYGPAEAAVLREGDAVERWTYDDLWTQAMAVARALVGCGIGKGTRVGILMTNRLEFLGCVLGTALAGGLATPISTFYTAPELDEVVQAAGISILLVERRVLRKDFVAMLAGLEPAILSGSPAQELASLRFPWLRRIAMIGAEPADGRVEDWKGFLARGDGVSEARIAATAAAVKPSDPGLLLFSSGSTGKAKGILSANRAVCLQLWRWPKWYNIQTPPRTWSANGFFWSGNFVMALGGTLSSGGSLVLQRWFDAEDALRVMEAEKVTMPLAWPHQWAQLTAAPNYATTDLSSLHYIDMRMPLARHPTVTTQWLEPGQAYGNTETFTLITVFASGTPAEVSGDSHGVPTAGSTIKIVDPLTGVTLARGERGEIAVKGPTLMLGYLGVPLDESLDDEGFLRTSDGGYVDEAGRLVWEGRLNDIIKTGGANVSPLEIDAVLRECPGVKIVQTVGVPDELLGEMVVSCIVAHDGAVIDEEAVRAFAKTRLASYKLPRRVLLFAEHELATTGSAKVKTAELRKLAADRLRAA